MKNLRTAFIRLAHENPETRSTLLPLVKRADKWEKMPKGWTDESRKEFWETLTGDVKHKVTKCIKEMEGKFDDPGAFCASLADRVDPGWRSRTAMKQASLRSKLIRLAHEKPELRPALLPLVKSAADKEEEAWEYALEDAKNCNSYVKNLTSAVKRKDLKGTKDQLRVFKEFLEGIEDTLKVVKTSSADFASRSRAAKEAATVNPQPFGRGEWNTYSGATSFADGSDPIFAAATLEAIIVADAGGIQLTLMGDDSTTDTVYHMNASFSSQKDAIRAAQSALRLIRTGRIPPGFKPL